MVACTEFAAVGEAERPGTNESRPTAGLRFLVLPSIVAVRARQRRHLLPEAGGISGKHIRERDAQYPESIGQARIERLTKTGKGEVRTIALGSRARAMPSGGVMLDGGPTLSEGESTMLASDVSSIVSISERLVASDTEEDDGLHDRQKYRLPDIGKTRLHLRTKEPLSPTPRRVVRSPVLPDARSSTPSDHRGSQDFRSLEPIRQLNYSRANGSSENVSDSDFVGSGLSRAGSVYTLGRASLAGQLSHLMSLRLPNADSLARRISSMTTSQEASKALSDAAEQIRVWISKASDVLDGLNAEDDVEWAAAGGMEGVGDFDKAISQFQDLIEAYVLSIERLQARDDVATLSAVGIMSNVQCMESIVSSWQIVKDTLKSIKQQVEIAMEWEELWNTVLGEIAQELEGLNSLVFEMEERRHQGADGLLSSKESIDINELETIVEDRPGRGAFLNIKRFSVPMVSTASPMDNPPVVEQKNESSLLALFARMQPLRASLDFLPMRLSVFHSRGNSTFPSACLDLEHRRDQMEAQWEKLEADADFLRKELGEDRWVSVFHNAGRQALRMEESITRSFNKLKEAVENEEHYSDAQSYARKVESYEEKKKHYGPAIERVLTIIDRGVQDRLTVNGDILRLQSEMKIRWTNMQAEMRNMELKMDDARSDSRENQLRDSVSTVTSSHLSITSSAVDGMSGSSPASSIAASASRKSSFRGSRTPTPLMNTKTRTINNKAPSSIPRRTPLSTSREYSRSLRSSPIAAPAISTTNSRAEQSTSSRPRWINSRLVDTRDFLPLSTLEPSPYAKTPVVKQTNFLRSTSHPTPSPAVHKPTSRIASTPRRTLPTPTSSRSLPQPSTRKSSLPVPIAKAPSRVASALAIHTPFSTRRPAPASAPTGRRSSITPQPKFTDGNDADTESPSHHRIRPASALASGRKSSMLPMRARGMEMTRE